MAGLVACDRLTELPHPVQLTVFANCPIATIGALAKTSRKINALLHSSDLFWKALVARDFPDYPFVGSIEGSTNFGLYKAMKLGFVAQFIHSVGLAILESLPTLPLQSVYENMGLTAADFQDSRIKKGRDSRGNCFIALYLDKNRDGKEEIDLLFHKVLEGYSAGLFGQYYGHDWHIIGKIDNQPADIMDSTPNGTAVLIEEFKKRIPTGMDKSQIIRRGLLPWRTER